MEITVSPPTMEYLTLSHKWYTGVLIVKDPLNTYSPLVYNCQVGLVCMLNATSMEVSGRKSYKA